MLRCDRAQKYAAFAGEGVAGFIEATGNFLMQAGSIETMRENLRGVSIVAPSRPVG
jgi:hypothetical protein